MDERRAPAEVHIDQALVAALLEDQHPNLLGQALTLIGEGWDNVTFRLGQDLAVRVPRRRVAVDLLLAEQRWLPSLAKRLPVAVPLPVATGRPSELFRWPWSVVRWLPGATADCSELSDDEATVVATFLRALHQPAPVEAPANPFRGVPLAERRPVVEERLERLGLDGLRPIWLAALDAGPADRRDWIHGDLHGRNVLVRDGRLAGVIDWGDMTGGDVATDLSCGWTLFDTLSARAALFEEYGASDAVLARAAGWAVNVASALLDSGEPGHVAMGEAAVRRLTTV